MILDYERTALLYAEKYGIIEYKVTANKMTYEEYFYGEGRYICVVDLDTLVEKRSMVSIY